MEGQSGRPAMGEALHVDALAVYEEGVQGRVQLFKWHFVRLVGSGTNVKELFEIGSPVFFGAVV